MKTSGIQMAAIKNMLNFPCENLADKQWHQLIFVDPGSPGCKIINVRGISMNHENMFRSGSALSILNAYYDQVQDDVLKVENTVCKKGCADCCTNNFDVSVVEFFMILRYLNINFPDNFLKDVSDQARDPIKLSTCLFVDQTTKECKIYEVRPLICRKYGLYENDTDCPKLQGSVQLLQKDFNTSLPKSLIYWFGNVRDGEILLQGCQELYEASYSKSYGDFLNIVFKFVRK